MTKAFLVLLLLANAMVLLGQIWPEGAPPFARAANIATLSTDVLLCAVLLLRTRPVRV
ncbi:MAG: hypothetical protein R3F56_19715 [Planctomycetota bacterium]